MYWTCFSFRRMIYASYILAAENHTLINGYFRQGCLACRFKLREKRLRNCVGEEPSTWGMTKMTRLTRTQTKVLERFRTSFSHGPAKLRHKFCNQHRHLPCIHDGYCSTPLPSSAESPETSCHPHGGSCFKLPYVVRLIHNFPISLVICLYEKYPIWIHLISSRLFGLVISIVSWLLNLHLISNNLDLGMKFFFFFHE